MHTLYSSTEPHLPFKTDVSQSTLLIPLLTWPSRDVDLRVTQRETNRIQLDWTEKPSYTYRINYRRVDLDDFWLNTGVYVDTTPQWVSGLESAEEYEFYLDIKKGGFDTTMDRQVSAYTKPTCPSLQFMQSSSSSIRVQGLKNPDDVEDMTFTYKYRKVDTITWYAGNGGRYDTVA